jgi:hypothetical protein
VLQSRGSGTFAWSAPFTPNRLRQPSDSGAGWTYTFDYVRFGRGVDILPSRFDEGERDGD